MEQEIEYNGFATPSLILDGSDKADKGRIVDQYAKTEDQDGLICGNWARGFEDGLIHLWLVKPVAAICDERQGWVNKRILLKEPLVLSLGIGNSGEASPKKEPEPDLETGVVKW